MTNIYFLWEERGRKLKKKITSNKSSIHHPHELHYKKKSSNNMTKNQVWILTHTLLKRCKRLLRAQQLFKIKYYFIK
jgi:hypothetical protein